MGKTKSAKAEKTTKTKAVKPGDATHYTDKGTRKFQANGPVEWGKIFKAASKSCGGTREGEGIRLAMAYAAGHEKAFLKWAAEQSPVIPAAVRP